MGLTLQISGMDVGLVEGVTVFFVLIYTIFFAVVGDRYSKKLNTLKAYRVKVYWKKMTEIEFSQKETFIKLDIRQLKIIAFSIVTLIGFIHFVVLFFINENIVFSLLIMMLFQVFMVLLFWLRGKSVLDMSKRYTGSPGGM